MLSSLIDQYGNAAEAIEQAKVRMDVKMRELTHARIIPAMSPPFFEGHRERRPRCPILRPPSSSRSGPSLEILLDERPLEP